jgi:U6 snRNA-associated Sm-like protein LSm7
MAEFGVSTTLYFYFTDLEDPYKLTGETRSLGLVVCRGGGVMCVYPSEGTQEIPNPFT